MHTIHLYLLGPPRVERAGATLVMDTRKATALLAYLALSGGQQSRDALAALLWPEYDDSRARAALRRTLSTLKAAVGDGILVATRDTIGLERAHVWCDVDDFRKLLDGQPDVDHLTTAVTLYRDAFMHGFSLRDSLPFDDWQLLQTQLLGRAFESALERLIRLLMADGRDQEALMHALRWLGHDPLREEGHRLVMELYARLGQRSAALRQYRNCVRVLDEELGVAPLEETTRLYHAIQEGALQHAARPAAPVSAPPPTAAASPARTLPLVGRATELAQMAEWYDAVGPDGRFLALTGEAGIGKTRLARAFASQLQAQDTAVLQATCYAGETALAYQLWEQALRGALARPAAAGRLRQLAPEWLAEAGRLVPELAQAAAPPAPLFGEDVARSRFFTGICHTVAALCAGDRPGMLLIDDVQWADEASLDLLVFLVRRLQARPLLVLVTWRDDEHATSARLRQLLTAVRRDGSGRQIALHRLPAPDTAQLIAAAGLDASAELVQRLDREAEGLPFMIVEYLAALRRQACAPPASWEMPVNVRDLLEERLAAVSDIGMQLLQSAAAIGREFDYDLLLDASGRREEEAVAVLEELVGRGLIRENRELTTAPTGYDFSHDKLRALVYEQTSLGRRRLLHRRLAETLAGRARRLPQPGALAAQIAAHFRLAGQDAAAVDYFRQAGDYARKLHAHHEALGHYQTALALGADATAALHAACGDLYTLQGRYTAALASYETAAAVATPDALGELEQKLGQVYLRQGEWALAEQQFAQAQARLGPDAPAVRLAQLNADWSLTAYRQGQQARAAALAEQALALAQTAGDASVLAQAHNMRGILARGAEDHAAALAHLTRSLALAEQSGRTDAQIAALNNLALAQHAAGQPADAQAGLERALALCLTLGDRHREAALRSNLADLLHAAGDDTAAREQIRQSVAIYAEIGREQGSWQSEIWKLMEW